MVTTPRSKDPNPNPNPNPTFANELANPAVRLWSVRDVAEYLKTSERFVRDHWRELGGIRMGGSSSRAGLLRFTKEAVERYLERSRLAG